MLAIFYGIATPDTAEQLTVAVALRLKDARKEKGLTLRAFEELCGVSNGGIHLIESGQRSPSLYNITRMAYALDLKVADLIADAERDVLG